MDFELDPPHGVGPLRIGLPRDAAAEVLASLADGSDADEPGQHVFRPSGLMVSVDCMPGTLIAVELGRPSTQVDRVMFRTVDVFALPAHEVVERVREHTSIIADPDDPASFIAPDLLLAFWRAYAADDDPEDEQGYYFSSVLLAEPGYFDTRPA